MIRISRLYFPVTVLGPDVRGGIWLQGCSIGCPGCMARDTWSPEGGTRMSITEVVDTCRGWLEQGAAGITISGGDPFDQPEALKSLLVDLRELIRSTGTDVDILCYSGRRLSWLQRHHSDILDLLDVLIPEPYRPDAGAGGPWRGSANQPIIQLTDLARQRYTPPVLASAPKRLQFGVEDDGIWIIGVPAPGDLDRITSALAAKGLIVEGDVS